MPSRKKILSKHSKSPTTDNYALEVDMERFMDASYDDEVDEEEEMVEEYRKTFGHGSNLEAISEKPSDEAGESGSKHESPPDLNKKKSPEERARKAQ